MMISVVPDSCTLTTGTDNEMAVALNYYAPWDTDTVFLSLLSHRNGVSEIFRADFVECDINSMIRVNSHRLRSQAYTSTGGAAEPWGDQITGPVPAIGPIGVTVMGTCVGGGATDDCSNIASWTGRIHVEGVLNASDRGL